MNEHFNELKLVPSLNTFLEPGIAVMSNGTCGLTW